MHKRILYILLFVFALFGAQCQDMHFSQFYASPLYLNPAFTGANVCSRLSIAYRNQWPGISTAYSSCLASFDHSFSNNNVGVGIQFASDVAGTGGLKTTMVNPLFSYEAALSRKYSLRFGVQPGITMKSINMNNLTFGDQLARGGNVSTVEVPVQSRTFLDFGAGALFYGKGFWLGTSFYHLNRPDESLFWYSNARLPIRCSVHGGYRYDFNKGEKNDDGRKLFTAAFNYRRQAKFDQLDLGFYFTRNIFNLGFWYRGIPLLKSYKPGYPNNDAVCIIIGLETDRVNIGYSYDITVSGLAAISRGAHEITLSYQMCKLKPKKKKARLVNCPKF
ncbi:MAG: PorP/SprF family type IX secretion system membrane protein [Bacteroidetes bacterium]|nr:PorP/SprF family type IX secretion system membrane protein [Bacteroidota bacterium]